VRPRPRNAFQIRAGLGAGELEDALRAEARLRERQLSARLYMMFFTRAGLRRLFHYVLGSVVMIPLLNVVLTPLTLRDLRIQLATAAAFGVLMALFRPRGMTVGLLLAATLLATLTLTGHVGSLDEALNVILALLVYFGLGLALGVSENIVRHGE
jgi:hypothetical protein